MTFYRILCEAQKEADRLNLGPRQRVWFLAGALSAIDGKSTGPMPKAALNWVGRGHDWAKRAMGNGT